MNPTLAFVSCSYNKSLKLPLLMHNSFVLTAAKRPGKPRLRNLVDSDVFGYAFAFQRETLLVPEPSVFGMLAVGLTAGLTTFLFRLQIILERNNNGSMVVPVLKAAKRHREG